MRKGFGLLIAAALACAALRANAGDDGVDAAVDAIHVHAAGHRLVLLGEFHGTREIPLLVGALVAREAVDGPVELALEVPRDEQPALDAALDARTAHDARRLLLARAWWDAHDDRHDGRRSHDMLDLIERVRDMRAHGVDVVVRAYDVAADTPGHDAGARDRAMAERVCDDFLERHATRLLVLGGNVHAMLERPADAPAQMQAPMGRYLRDLDPVSVRITARSGDFWACPAPRRCGPLATDGARAQSGPMSGEYTYQVVLPRFHVGRLIGAAPRGADAPER